MTRHFQNRDQQLFDYKLGSVRQLPGIDLRGPVPDVSQPYFVCVGATQVFGRFCNQPFPELLSERLGLPALNLGLSGHGPQAFLQEDILALINGARFAVIQLVSGRIGSNSEFANSPSGRGEGERLRDGTLMTYESFLSEEMANYPHDHVKRIVEQTRESWVGHYRSLLTAITVPTVVHWFSTGTPYLPDDYGSMWRLFGPFPQMVNERMIRRIRPFCSAYVETVCRRGLPQPLWTAEREIGGTELRNGRLFNKYYPSPEMHQAAASDLLPVCRLIAGGRVAGGEAGEKPVVVSATMLDANVMIRALADNADVFSYPQLLVDTGMLPLLAAQRSRIVHLRRRDLLESYLLDRQSNGDDGSVRDQKLDAGDFARHVQDMMAAEQHVTRSCRNAEPHQIFMEEVLADPEAGAEQIAQRLGHGRAAAEAIAHSVKLMPKPRRPDDIDGIWPVIERLSRQLPHTEA